MEPPTHRVDRGARGASVASERRCCQPGTPTNRPARGSRKRARLCRVARAGKRFRRQCLPARHAAPSREPEIGLCTHTPLGKSMGPTGPRWLMNGGAANRARRQSVPPVAVGSRPGSVGLHGRVKASDGTWPFSVKMTTGRDEIHAVADGWKSAKRAPGENRPPSPDLAEKPAQKPDKNPSSPSF